MAKKKKEVLVEEPVQVKNTSPKWEMKDRQYYLRKDGRPLTYVLQSKSTRKKPLLWFFCMNIFLSFEFFFKIIFSYTLLINLELNSSIIYSIICSSEFSFN